MENCSQYIAQFIDHLKNTISFTKEEESLIISSLEVVSLKKKGFLLKPGEHSQHMRYIANGSMRVYYLDENAQEHTLQLGIESWWVNDLYSYLSGKTTRMYIQAVENSVVVQILKDDLELLFSQIPQLNDFFRIKMQNAYVTLQERTLENLRLDAYAKYEKFRNDYKDMEQRFPQYIIASYLGMTPEFLSYLRKKHSY